MMVVVAYNVNTENEKGQRRLRRVARLCVNHGQRVQKSVFECLVDPAMWTKLRSELIDEIDPSIDSLRFYFLGSNWQRRLEQIGAKPSFDPQGPLIV